MKITPPKGGVSLYVSDAFTQVDTDINGFVAGGTRILQTFKKNLDAALCQKICVLAYGGESGGSEAADKQTVKTHDGYIFRNTDTTVLQCAEGADGHDVGHGKKRCNVPVSLQQIAGSPITTLIGVAGFFVIPCAVKINAVSGKGIQTTLIAISGGIGILELAANYGKAAVTL